MLESTAVGAIIGALSRLAPELLKYVDRHLDRRHELAMQGIALKFEEKRPDGAKLAEIAMTGSDTAVMLDALKEGWRQQFQTGDKNLDRVSVLVRPCVTYALIVLYGTVKIAALGAALSGAIPWASAYGDADLSFMSGIMSFWFLGRVWDKKP